MMFEKIKMFKNHIQFFLYKDYQKYVFNIYNNYNEILNIISRYNDNDVFRETRLSLFKLSIQERMNDLNYYCKYEDDDDIINSSPLFENTKNIKIIKKVKQKKRLEWLQKLFNDINNYETELIIRLNINMDDFEG